MDRIRLGILALPAAGVLILAGDVLLPGFGGLSDTAAYARTVISAEYQIAEGA